MSGGATARAHKVAAALAAGILMGGCTNDKPDSSPVTPTGPAIVGDYTIATLHLGSKMQSVAVDSDAHTAVVTGWGADTKSAVFVLDTATRSISTTIPASTIHRIAIDPVNHTAYVTSYTGLLLLDTGTRAATGSIDVPGNTLDVAIDPDTHTGFVVISVAGLGVVDLAARKFGYALEPRPGGISNDASVATDLVSHNAYMTSNEDLWILGTTAPLHADAQIQLGMHSTAISADPATRLVYVAGTKDGAGRLAVIDPATRKVTATISVGRNPSSSTVDPTDHTIYVTNYDDNTLSIVDGVTNTVKATVPVGRKPMGVAVDPTNHTVYVTNYDDGTLSIITHR